MQTNEITAILAALLIGSRQGISPAQAVEIAEDIQRTIEAHDQAARLAAQERAIRATAESDAALSRLLAKLNPEQ